MLASHAMTRSQTCRQLDEYLSLDVLNRPLTPEEKERHNISATMKRFAELIQAHDTTTGLSKRTRSLNEILSFCASAETTFLILEMSRLRKKLFECILRHVDKNTLSRAKRNVFEATNQFSAETLPETLPRALLAEHVANIFGARSLPEAGLFAVL